MKNVWKGLVVGAFAGAAVGVALDMIDRAGRQAAVISRRAKTGAKHLASAVEDKVVPH
jgi:hypothetical protein